MFTYKELKIVSAVPMDQISAYLCELGAVESPDPANVANAANAANITNAANAASVRRYECAGLEIEITANKDDAFPDLGVPRHTIAVHGDRTLAEDFLTAFRMRFMSAGG